MSSGIRFAPHESLHATHRRADEQMQMVHLQSLREKNLRRADHVRIIVVRKFRPQAVARFRGFSEAGAELIGKNQIIFRRIEQLAGAEEHTRE